ncbi:MAG: hypothetical protein EA400_07420 [Chromatiaceae bacterium]|nr:MAG: hypothetical protein EA400_07420 [Chromatiaceae bacterium]
MPFVTTRFDPKVLTTPLAARQLQAVSTAVADRSPTQTAWVSGYLAGLAQASSSPAASAAVPPPAAGAGPDRPRWLPDQQCLRGGGTTGGAAGRRRGGRCGRLVRRFLIRTGVVRPVIHPAESFHD